jgi:hypothetical protein
MISCYSVISFFNVISFYNVIPSHSQPHPSKRIDESVVRNPSFSALIDRLRPEVTGSIATFEVQCARVLGMFATCDAQPDREAAVTRGIVGIDAASITPGGEFVTSGGETFLVRSVGVAVLVPGYDGAIFHVLAVAAVLALGLWTLELHVLDGSERIRSGRRN